MFVLRAISGKNFPQSESFQIPILLEHLLQADWVPRFLSRISVAKGLSELGIIIRCTCHLQTPIESLRRNVCLPWGQKVFFKDVLLTRHYYHSLSSAFASHTEVRAAAPLVVAHTVTRNKLLWFVDDIKTGDMLNLARVNSREELWSNQSTNPPEMINFLLSHGACYRSGDSCVIFIRRE